VPLGEIEFGRPFENPQPDLTVGCRLQLIEERDHPGGRHRRLPREDDALLAVVEFGQRLLEPGERLLYGLGHMAPGGREYQGTATAFEQFHAEFTRQCGHVARHRRLADLLGPSRRGEVTRNGDGIEHSQAVEVRYTSEQRTHPATVHIT